MFTDEHRRIVWDQIRQHDLRAFAKWLSPELMTAAAAQAGIRVGQGPLYVVNLAWLAVSSALHTSKNFADVLTLTLKLLAGAPSIPARKWVGQLCHAVAGMGGGRTRNRRIRAISPLR